MVSPPIAAWILWCNCRTNGGAERTQSHAVLALSGLELPPILFRLIYFVFLNFELGTLTLTVLLKGIGNTLECSTRVGTITGTAAELLTTTALLSFGSASTLVITPLGTGR